MKMVIIISGGVVQHIIADESCNVVVIDKDVMNDQDPVSVEQPEIINAEGGEYGFSAALADENKIIKKRISELEKKNIL